MTFGYIQLPFSLKAVDRERFDVETEIASVFCLAEERRKKKGLLSGTEENFSYLLKTNYPLYAMRWRDRCILLDGLGSISEYVIYRDITDVEQLLSNLSKSSEKVGTLRAFLANNSQTFSEFRTSRRKQLNYVLSNVALLSELTDFLQRSPSVLPNREISVCVRVDRTMVEQIIEEFDTLVTHLEQDIESLEKIDKNIRSSIEKAIRDIITDKEEELGTHNQELEKLRPIVEKNVEELRKKRSADLLIHKEALEKETAPINEEMQICENDVKRMNLIEQECNKEKKVLVQREDKVGSEYWSKQAELNKAQAAEIWKAIKECSERLEKIQFKSDAAEKRLMERYDMQIKAEEKRLEELENKRDADAEIKELVIKEIEHRYSLISSQISNLIKVKHQDKSRLFDMTISWTPEKNSVLLVPLYLTKYQSEDKRRYDVYSPVVVQSHASFKNFRISFGGLESKISHLIIHIGKESEEFLAKGFLNMMTSNKKFEEAVLKSSLETNLLTDTNRGKIFGKGLEYLKGKGLLTNEDYKRMLHALNLSFSLASRDT